MIEFMRKSRRRTLPMNMKKSIIALGAALLIGLSGCGKQTQI